MCQVVVVDKLSEITVVLDEKTKADKSYFRFAI